MTDHETFRLDHVPAATRGRWLAVYQLGVEHGIEIGRRQLEDEWRGTQEVSAAIARQVAERGPFAALAERRGDHARAARQRAILAERGVIA